MRASKESGEAKGGSTRRVEYVSAQVLMVNAQHSGSSLSSSWVQETVTASH